MPFALPHALRGLLRSQPVSSAPATARTLGAGAVLRLHLRGGDALQVRVGGLWLTRTGDPQDHLLQPGVGFVAARSGDVVVQAFGACACHFEWHGLERRRLRGRSLVGHRPTGGQTVQVSDAGVS